MNIEGKKVLVTGGAGFIGSRTVRVLLDGGADVVIVDNFLTGRSENIHPQARLYEMNIADEKMIEIMERERPDFVYLFAHYVLVPKSVENPLEDLDCIIGALRILQAAKRMNVCKVVLASSGFLYGNNKNLPMKETEPISPISPYIVSKHAIEQYLQFYRDAFGIPFVVLRYPAVYGPRQVTGAMADYIRKLVAGDQADIWGDGTKTRDYLHVDDVVRANLLALDIPHDHPHPVFNLGTGRETTLNDLYRLIARLVGKEAAPRYHDDRPGEQMRYCLDASKIRTQCGWEPTITLEDGLKQILGK